MVYEARKQSMAWMETDYSNCIRTVDGREHLGALGIMGEIAQHMFSLLKLKGFGI